MFETQKAVLVVDRSGSMSCLESETVTGINEVLSTLKTEIPNGTVTVILFDHKLEYPVKDVLIKDVAPMKEEEFIPRGSTSLMDAIGAAIVSKPDLIYVFTDGLENTSKEFTPGVLKDAISRYKKDGKVIFFIGCDEAVLQAETYGIAREHTLSIPKSSKGVMDSYKTMSHSVSLYSKGESIDLAAVYKGVVDEE